MQPFAVRKWPEICDFRRHRATVGVSSNVTKLRKVTLYANKLRLPMGVKRWEHMLSKWRQDGEGSAAMRKFCPHADKWCLENRVRNCLHSEWSVHWQSFILFMIWYIMPCCNLYSNTLPSRMLIFSNNEKTTTTTKRFLVLPLILYCTRNKSLLW